MEDLEAEIFGVADALDLVGLSCKGNRPQDIRDDARSIGVIGVDVPGALLDLRQKEGASIPTPCSPQQ